MSCESMLRFLNATLERDVCGMAITSNDAMYDPLCGFLILKSEGGRLDQLLVRL